MSPISPHLAAGARLGPYELVAPLGVGGMGEVYRARDTRLGREVAVKVLPTAFASDPDRLRRFEHEARAVAALDHPNILAIHDVGTHEGGPYIVTELLEGETLRERMEGEGLTLRGAVDVGIEIVRGLAAAHGKGIVHRDLKPSNVFLTKDGQVKLLDFGLAKVTRPEPPADAPTQRSVSSTETGAVLGTAGYMSPEQVRGMATDARTDIFSFGCVLHEMISGERPFRGDTTSDVMAAILKEDPAPLPVSAPATLRALVNRCLEKRPEDRFTSAHDLALALRAVEHVRPRGLVARTAAGLQRPGTVWAAAALGIVALAIAGGLWLSRRPAPASRAAGPKRIAVLPFENLGAAEDAYFADGMTDEVRGKLAALSGLAVIARVSSDQYSRTTKPPKQICEELSTPFLLTARIRWQKDASGTSRIRVTPELVEVGGAGPPTTRWQDSIDAELRDVFRVQEEIATRVAAALEVTLGAGERRKLAERPTANLAAYDAYLRGQEISADLGRMVPQALRSAVAQYEEAVALDPGFALAWAQLSRARSNLHFRRVPSPASAEGARDAAERALGLAPDLSEAHLAMGAYYNLVTLEPGRAAEELALGLASAPDHPGLLTGLAHAERKLGRWDEARVHLEHAASLDPRSVLGLLVLGDTLLWQRRYPEALATCDRALVVDPSNVTLYHQKAVGFLARGDLAGARAVVAAAAMHVDATTLVAHVASCLDNSWVLDQSQQDLLLRLTPSAFDDDRAVWARVLAEASALRGDGAGARRFAEEARRAYEGELAGAPDNAEGRVLHGLALAYLGRREEAIREGERSLELVPISRDAYQGALDQHQAVRIYIILGEHGKALDLLEPLLAVPYCLSPGWLSIDPTFAPLRGNPRFEKLLRARG